MQLCLSTEVLLMRKNTKSTKKRFSVVHTEINSFQVVLKEPRRSSVMNTIMMQYENAVANPREFGMHCTGALMLAVFRGKVVSGFFSVLWWYPVGDGGAGVYGDTFEPLVMVRVSIGKTNPPTIPSMAY